MSNGVNVNKQDLDGFFSLNCVPGWPNSYTEKAKESIQILWCHHHPYTNVCTISEQPYITMETAV
jgi:hypothetical protein